MLKPNDNRLQLWGPHRCARAGQNLPPRQAQGTVGGRQVQRLFYLLNRGILLCWLATGKLTLQRNPGAQSEQKEGMK